MSYAAKPTARPGRRNYIRKTSEPLHGLVIALQLTATERERLNVEARARDLLPTGLARIAIERMIQAGLFETVLGETPRVRIGFGPMPVDLRSPQPRRDP